MASAVTPKPIPLNNDDYFVVDSPETEGASKKTTIQSPETEGAPKTLHEMKASIDQLQTDPDTIRLLNEQFKIIEKQNESIQILTNQNALLQSTLDSLKAKVSLDTAALKKEIEGLERTVVRDKWICFGAGTAVGAIGALAAKLLTNS